MTREELIKKWLDNDLNIDETKAFKALEDYDALIKLSENVQKFKAPNYDINEAYSSIKQKIDKNTSTQKINWLRHAMQIAVVLVVCFGVYYFATSQDTIVNTLMAEKSTVQLPDNSEVMLNAESSITYNTEQWSKKRNLQLNGEAFFKVMKGETFTVTTSSGEVTVLGTQFKVKQRSNLFEVVCYEGSVKVVYANKTEILKSGDNFLIIDGKYIAKEKETATNPSWTHNKSYFKSMPFKFVINEFERQYNLSVEATNIDLKQLFTGNFVHDNKELALKSITLPLNLNYTIKGNSTVILSRE